MFYLADPPNPKLNIYGSTLRALQFWKYNLKANAFVLNMVEFGYALPFKALPSKFLTDRNNSSSLRHANFVTDEIKKLLACNFIVEMPEPSFCVNPLTVADNSDKLRLVLDLKHVNDFLDVKKI